MSNFNSTETSFSLPVKDIEAERGKMWCSLGLPSVMYGNFQTAVQERETRDPGSVPDVRS